MLDSTESNLDTRRLARHAEALRNRLLRRWLSGAFRRGLRRLGAFCAALRGEAELRALDAHELHDLGLDRSGIAYAARHGRENQGDAASWRPPYTAT